MEILEISVVEFQLRGFLRKKMNTFKGNFNRFEMEYHAGINLTFFIKKNQ